MEIIRRALADESVLLDVHAQNLDEIFQITTQRLVERGVIASDAQQTIANALAAREDKTSTAIGHAVAVPHVYLPEIAEPTVVFVRLAQPLNLGAPDGIPTRFLFFLLGPPAAVAQHLDTLANIARLMADEEFRYEARIARSSQELVAGFDHFVQRTTVVPRPAPTVPEGLRFTGRLGGGIVADVARRWPHYASDWRDGLHPKCLASTLFLYFACLAPTITFGGLMAVNTDGEIGAVEMLVATAICGIVYALTAGQPLSLLGGTGPVLVFTTVLYSGCQDWQLPFLATYAWVGLWAALWLVLMAVLDAGALMRFFTRFTDETFAALISLIFIYEALYKVAQEFSLLETSAHHSTALLTLLLTLGTFYVAISLSRFRRSSYLRPWLREFLADFGPTLAIVAMTGFAFWLHEVDLSVLNVPEQLATTSGRPWLVDVWAVPDRVKLLAAGPAILLAVLVYLDHNITVRLVNSSDHKLQKGPAYHSDLLIVGGLVGFCSVFGLPWMVAATVRSLNHVRSLATTEEVVTGSGHSKERVIHVRENRVTPLAIHALIATSLLWLGALKFVPLAVLYGVFLFMGVVSISGNQFFERMSLWLKDPQLYPATHYIRKVPMPVIHAFTAIQAACLALLWLVKTSSVSAIALLFPLFIAAVVPVRLWLGRYFAPVHLEVLDADEEPEQEGTQWAG